MGDEMGRKYLKITWSGGMKLGANILKSHGEGG